MLGDTRGRLIEQLRKRQARPPVGGVGAVTRLLAQQNTAPQDRNPFSEPSRRNEFEDLTPEDRQKVIDKLKEGRSPDGALAPEGYDPRESRFDDAGTYRTAELDAFKLMGLSPNYGAPAGADINTTEGGRLSLLRRMMFADAALEDPRLVQAMTRMDNSVAGRMGALGRLYTGDEYELGHTMAQEFANAVLRNDSGAQAPEQEVQRYIRQYFPLPNEGPTQLQAKKALRREVIRSLMQSLGGDPAPAVQQVVQEIEELKRQADVPEGNGEISDEDREFLRSLGLE